MNAAFHLIYLACATGFVVGLHMMNSPATARRGNQVSSAAMAVAVGTTVVLLVRAGSVRPVGWLMLAAGAAVGGAAGLYAARTVAMTAMPQLVSVFNAVGGGAAALLAVDDLLRSGGAPVAAALDILIGAVTFSGSLVAAGKLQGWVPSQPIVFPGARALNVVLGLAFLGGGGWLVADPHNRPALVVLAVGDEPA